MVTQLKFLNIHVSQKRKGVCLCVRVCIVGGGPL